MNEKKERYETADCWAYDCLKENQMKNKKQATEAESLLWMMLRNNQTGYKFRRQHVIDEYIADFVCIKEQLIVEVDGEYHNTLLQQELDKERTERLNILGYNVLRFTNEEVLFSPETVINKIIDTIQSNRMQLKTKVQ